MNRKPKLSLLLSALLPVSMMTSVVTPALPAFAIAAEQGTSDIAGVALPKGSARWNDGGLSSGLGRLLDAGAKEFNLPTRPGGPGKAEVYTWSGASYKEDRAPFMYTLLQNALTEAGYTYTLVDGSVENTPNAFDTDAYGTEPLDLAPFEGRPQYFRANNPKKGKTIVGVWFNQPSKKRLVLALGEVGFAGAPVVTKAPEIANDPTVWLVKDLKNATAGMPAPPLPAFQKLAKKPRTVRGLVLDGGGKPIAGAQLIAWASAAGGFRTSYQAKTNAQGIYEIPLPVGICQIVNADCKVNYNGKTLVLPLHPADGERDQFDSKPGHIENFVLRTSGVASDTGGSYGAPMRVLDWNMPDGGIIEVTLKPVGTLLDGSKGRTLVFRFKVKPGVSGENFFGGIPIGRYKLTARVYDGEDALPVRAKPTFYVNGEEVPLASSVDVVFEDNGGGHASLGQSGIKAFEVTLQP